MRLRKYTKRKSATGKPYPQCQHVEAGAQCEKPVYADGRCWTHQERAGSPTRKPTRRHVGGVVGPFLLSFGR